MPPRRPQGTNALASLDPRERHCLETGNYAHLVFDSEGHHEACWRSVRDEMLSRPGQPLPEALFRFELLPKYGPRLAEIRPATQADGRVIPAKWIESDQEYLQRHKITKTKIVKGQQ